MAVSHATHIFSTQARTGEIYSVRPENADMSNPVFREIVAEMEQFFRIARDLRELQEFSVRLIAERLPHYNWVGFYMLDSSDETVLVLGPFHGTETEHVRIPVTQGICGRAVVQGETVIVDDVSADPSYLSCSIATRSEIVVPIRVASKVIGEIDVDSHRLNAFGGEDRRFLEECAAMFGKYLEQASIKDAGPSR